MGRAMGVTLTKACDVTYQVTLLAISVFSAWMSSRNARRVSAKVSGWACMERPF